MSQCYIESAIKHNGGLGLFDKTSGELVACVFKNDLDGIAHLYTVPDRYNRGYGSTLAKAMAKLIAVDHQQHVQTFISPNNEKSIRLDDRWLGDGLDDSRSRVLVDSGGGMDGSDMMGGWGSMMLDGGVRCSDRSVVSHWEQTSASGSYQSSQQNKLRDG
uniref:GCN5-related N-acetyltransferase Rv2170-like domain-containing protein n=1 Tax=Anopheles minimus TaxID=112268 RepID=A0A182W8E8_9DIPT